MEEHVLRAPVDHDILDETLPEYLLRKAKEHDEAGKTVWIEDVVTGESHTFGNLEAETRSMASFLHKHGMRKGDTLIFMSSSMVKTSLLFIGIWRANGTARASYPEDDSDTLLFRVEESRVGWIFCDPGHVEMCLEVAEKVYWDVEVIVDGDAEGCISFSELLEDDGEECPEQEYDLDYPAVVLCTSGTTGRSKGAIHSHHSFVNTLYSICNYSPFSAVKPNLLVSKATHVTGSMFPLVCLGNGFTALVMSAITKENLFESVDKYKPGFIWGFPTFLLQMINDPEAVNYDFSSVNVIGSGGAQITPAMQTALHQLPNLESFINMYGLTEVCPVAFEIDVFDPPKKLDGTPPFSVGKVAPGGLLTVRDPETGEVLGPNQRGELCIKTKCNFVGYIQNPQATEEAFIDGYFRTGDIGYFDENEFVFIVDRLKEIFKYFNNHVSPTELEDVISQHEGVNEVCVFGITDPAGGGHIPRACVTVKSEDVTAEEILEFANEKLPDYKRLRGGVFIVDALPRGKTGKITRNLVAQMSLPEQE